MGFCSCKRLTLGVVKTGSTTLLFILIYYTFSISLTFYNKKVVMRFQYPLIMTFIHLVVKFTFASCVRNILECCKGRARVILSWKDFALRVGPVGITSILDIALSNWSFEYITVSLYTMTKTSAIAFLLLFALLLKVEKFRWLQVCVVICISLGLFLFTFESTQFNVTGFVMCLAASILSGLRWSLTQLIAQKDEMGLANPVDFMYHIQPWMMCGLLPIAIYAEGVEFAGDDNFVNYKSALTVSQNIGILLGGAMLAFGLEFVEFQLVRTTSSLTLSVSAMFKECVVLLIAHWLNHDEMNFINGLGLVACIAGVALHVYLKATKQTEPPAEEEINGAAVALLSSLDLDSHDEISNSDEETVT